jgi:hypothetical protein
MKFRIATPLVTTAFALLLGACSSLPGQKADIDAVMTASGLDAQISMLDTPLHTDKMNGPLAMIPDEWITLVNSTISENVKPEQIRADLRSALAKNLSGAELNSVQKFYESDTGKHVVAIESGKADTSTIGTGNNGSDRATLDALANATGYGKAVSQLAQHGLNDAVDVAVKNGCFGLDQVPFASMLVGVVKKAQLAVLRENVNSLVRERYTRLSADEQATYLAFAQSSAGQKFFAARGSVMQETAQRTGDALNGQLGQRVMQVCKARA